MCKSIDRLTVDNNWKISINWKNRQMWAAVGIIHDRLKASSLTKSPKGHN
jgi:hypothetical protein